jgi:hypothetical protein
MSINKATSDRVIATLSAAGFSGESLRKAWAIVMRESGGNPTAYNPDRSTGDDSRGLFQINMLGQMGKDRDAWFRRDVPGYTGIQSLYNPQVNARAAYVMSKRGTDFYHWDIDSNGYDGGSHAPAFNNWYRQYPGGGSTTMAGTNRSTATPTGTPPDDTYLSGTWVQNADGTVTGQQYSQTPKETVKKPEVLQKEYLAKLGVYQAFLDKHPQIAALIREAIKNYAEGDPWDDARFQAAYSQTKFAQERSKAEEEFDLGMGGANADTYQKKVKDMTDNLMQQADRLGITVPPETLAAKAREIVRSNLPQQSVDKFWMESFGAMPQAAQGAPSVGTANSIQEQLRTMAMNYGIKLDAAELQKLTGQALGQGERWQEWVQGREDVFRQQAKMLYPNAGDMLNTMNLKDLSGAYFADAAETLGVSTDTMELTDPKWTGFMNGEGGRVLSRDEWVRVLKTDPKYGYDRSTRARQEAASLGDALLGAFGLG